MHDLGQYPVQFQLRRDFGGYLQHRTLNLKLSSALLVEPDILDKHPDRIADGGEQLDLLAEDGTRCEVAHKEQPIDLAFRPERPGQFALQSLMAGKQACSLQPILTLDYLLG